MQKQIPHEAGNGPTANIFVRRPQNNIFIAGNSSSPEKLLLFLQ